jgi:two-component system, chemotaxis family, response regulator Rcp1
MTTKERRRVLVVDDNPDHLLLTRRALRAYTNHVELVIDTVDSGPEALAYLNQEGEYVEQPRPHLVLLDLKMPGMSGFEVLEAIKRDPVLRKIPIVVLSSSDRPEDIAEAYDLGGNSYITKQVTIAGIREGLNEVADYWFDKSSLPEPPN